MISPGICATTKGSGSISSYSQGNNCVTITVDGKTYNPPFDACDGSGAQTDDYYSACNGGSDSAAHLAIAAPLLLSILLNEIFLFISVRIL